MHTDFYSSRKKKEKRVVPTGPKVDAFWDAIEPFGWGTKTTDYEAIRKALMEKWTLEQADEMRDVYHSLRGPLYDRLFHEVESCGDDSFDDLLAHIVGMGREEYRRNMENPELANERANKRKYRESFSYSLPHKHDYELLDPKHYREWFGNFIAELREGLKDDRYEPVWPHIQQMIALLEAHTDNPKGLLAVEQELHKAHETVVARSEWLFRGTWGGYSNVLTSKAGTENILSDLRKYLK